MQHLLGSRGGEAESEAASPAMARQSSQDCCNELAASTEHQAKKDTEREEQVRLAVQQGLGDHFLKYSSPKRFPFLFTRLVHFATGIMMFLKNMVLCIFPHQKYFPPSLFLNPQKEGVEHIQHFSFDKITSSSFPRLSRSLTYC